MPVPITIVSGLLKKYKSVPFSPCSSERTYSRRMADACMHCTHRMLCNYFALVHVI